MLINPEVNASALNLFNRFFYVHGDGTGTWVRHEAPRPEDATQAPHFAHHVRGSYRYIEV